MPPEKIRTSDALARNGFVMLNVPFSIVVAGVGVVAGENPFSAAGLGHPHDAAVGSIRNHRGERIVPVFVPRQRQALRSGAGPNVIGVSRVKRTSIERGRIVTSVGH